MQMVRTRSRDIEDIEPTLSIGSSFKRWGRGHGWARGICGEWRVALARRSAREASLEPKIIMIRRTIWNKIRGQLRFLKVQLLQWCYMIYLFFCLVIWMASPDKCSTKCAVYFSNSKRYSTIRVGSYSWCSKFRGITIFCGSPYVLIHFLVSSLFILLFWVVWFFLIIRRYLTDSFT